MPPSVVLSRVPPCDVPQGYASVVPLPAALLDSLFEQPADVKDQYGMPKDPELFDAERLFVWVLGNELDEERVIALPRGPKVHIIGQAPVHQPPKITVVPKAGLYRGGVLKSLMAWAIPSPTAEYTPKLICLSLFLFHGFFRHLLVSLTPI